MGDVVIGIPEAALDIERRPLHVGSVKLLGRGQIGDIEPVRAHQEVVVVGPAEVGPDIEGGQLGRLVGIMEVQIGIGSYPRRHVQRRAPHCRCVQAHVQKQGHQFLRIQPEPYPEQVLGAPLAVDFQAERFLLAEQFVRDVFIGPFAVDSIHGILHFGTGDHVSGMDTQFGPDIIRFLPGDARHLDTVDPDRMDADIDGGTGCQPERIPPKQPPHGGKRLRILLGRLISPDNHRVDSLGIETHHPVTGQVRLDPDIDHLEIPLEGIFGEHVDSPPEDVGDIVDLLIARLGIGQVHADDDVRSHLPGQVRREIVAHPTVHQHHALGPDGGEKARDGHGGAQGRIEAAVMPHLRPAGHHIRSDAGERDRKAQEIRGIRKSGRQAGKQVLDILAENITGRKAAHEAFHDQVVGIAVPGGQMQLAVA